MFGLGKKSESSSYDAGYNAGNEFLDVTDHLLSDEEASRQWNAVEANHDSEYCDGYYAAMEANSKGFWSKLLGG
jgi:hypothetical protein